MQAEPGVWVVGPEAVSVKSKPTPARATVAGVATADDVTVRTPVEEPLAGGPKTTEAVQLAPAARVLVQVFCVTLNGAAVARAMEPIA